MKAYRVYNLSEWGHEESVRYFKSPIVAEKEFHQRVKQGMLSDDTVSRDDVDGGPPVKIHVGPRQFRDKSTKLVAEVRYWDSFHTDCGDEWDIKRYEVIMQEIDIA